MAGLATISDVDIVYVILVSTNNVDLNLDLLATSLYLYGLYIELCITQHTNYRACATPSSSTLECLQAFAQWIAEAIQHILFKS